MKMDKFGHGRALLSIIVAYFALWISGKFVEKRAFSLLAFTPWRRCLRSQRQWLSAKGYFFLAITMSCFVWHSVAGSIVARPTRSSLAAWNSIGGFFTLAGMPANLALPSAFVYTVMSSL